MKLIRYEFINEIRRLRLAQILFFLVIEVIFALLIALSKEKKTRLIVSDQKVIHNKIQNKKVDNFFTLYCMWN